ncbi:MAG: 7TM diverse intracellular signaling domain-containing protein [Aquabacterium sp.]
MRHLPYRHACLTLRQRFLCWLACLCVCLCVSLCACTAAHAGPLPVLRIPDGANAMLLGQHMQLLRDEDGRQTLADVQDPNRDADWQPSHADAINFGLSRAVGWARISLRNDGPAEMRRVLDLDSSLADYVDVYIVQPDGTLSETMLTGDRRPFADRPLKLRTLAVPLQIKAGARIDVYLRLQTHDGLHEIIMPTLWQPQAFASHVQSDTLAFGLYYGVLITVLLYNLFLFVSTRQAGFGYYLLYVASVLMWSFSFRGYAAQYLWPDWPNFGNQAVLVFAGLSFVTLSMFAISYLDTRRSVPRWLHRAMLAFTGASVLALLPFFDNHYAVPFIVQSALGLVLMACMVLVNHKLVWYGNRPSRYFSCAFAALSLGVVIYYLRVMGAVPANALTDNFLLIGSAAEALLLAFGLADQMNTLKSEKTQGRA